jgi:uncharacterized phage-associated protein
VFGRFNPHKAVQAAGVILRAEGKRTTRLRLLKLLYIAERKCLQQTGRQLIGGKLVAMDHGPLHSDILDLINGVHRDEPLWSRYFTAHGPREVELTDEPEVGRLSKFETELLVGVSQMHEHCHDFALSELTHEFDEWAQSFHAGTSTPIPLELLVRTVCQPEYVEQVIQDMKDKAVFDEFFSESAA